MMKKARVLLLTPLIAVVLLTGLFIWTGCQPLKKMPEDGNIESKLNSEESPLLKDAVLVESLRSDRSADAEKRLLEFAKRKDAVGYIANTALAEIYAKQGKDAVPYYRQALELYDTKDIRKKLADYLKEKENYQEAAYMYGTLLPDDTALNSLLKLKLEPAEIGEILLKFKQWQSAADFLSTEIDKAREGGLESKLESQYGMTLAAAGEYEKALPILEKINNTEFADEDTKWWYGRSLEAVGQLSKAKDIYSLIGGKGAYRLGAILEAEGDIKGAAEAYAKSNEPDSKWKAARLFEESGMKSKALEIYTQLSKEEGSYQDDAAYRAYVLIIRGTGSGAQEMLDIISKHPAWMVRLGKEPDWQELPEIIYSRPQFLERYEAYKKSGRQLMAQIELSIGEKEPDLAGKLSLGDWYLEQGDKYQAVVWGIRALKEYPNRHAYELAYQRPYRDQVHKAAEEFNLDPNLLWALMREESYFTHDAVSWVGALGLMQIMPSTGQDIAFRLKVNVTDKDLLNPDINIRFGAFYIRSMLNMFSGDIDKALAAYNGGPGNVNKWKGSMLGSTKLDFPTAITFTETREYITKVANSYYIYQKLYGNK